MAQKIVLLEDDKKLAKEIKQFLSNHEFNCVEIYDGKELADTFSTLGAELYILDINVPGMTGIEVCKHIRQAGANTPILMLTALGEVDDRVNALESGADDYLVKPFSFDELKARIKALLRRGSYLLQPDGEVIVIADLEVNTSEMSVKRSGKVIELTPKEYKLLEVLMKSKGKIVNRKTIVEGVWGINFETGTNAVEVYINFLRNKIDKGYDVKLIHNRSGYGYYVGEDHGAES
jgi:DNA-binding response OmpR family regulator